ncbi:LOW QUALITY PROTEIN: uncharacterized protein ACNS7B_012937 [Menidia menidia]
MCRITPPPGSIAMTTPRPNTPPRIPGTRHPRAPPSRRAPPRRTAPPPPPPVQLCLPPPELLPSPVVPPGGAFTPSDPQSLEPLDPAASAQLLDNIMAWFNSNINPQNNPQSLALVPSPPTTETDSSPDPQTGAEAESHTSGAETPALLWPPLEGEPEGGGSGEGGPKAPRPSSLELDSRGEAAGGGGGGCVADLSLDDPPPPPPARKRPRPGHGLRYGPRPPAGGGGGPHLSSGRSRNTWCDGEKRKRKEESLFGVYTQTLSRKDDVTCSSSAFCLI